MACPTCNCTMQMIFNATNHKAWWCPRCGTIKDQRLGLESGEAPKLVERCRQLQALMVEAKEENGLELLRQLWILEAINVPEARRLE